jgi:L-ascorbate metabolism protein UlaG (beta-lactamase superfamily)
LPGARTVVTTASGASRLQGNAQGLLPWGTMRLEAAGKPTIDVVATPCRHGPPGTHFIVGDVIGFALRWSGQQYGDFWISGDTVLYAGVREVARRLNVGTALMHMGGVQFPVTGPLHYTMTAREAVALCELLQPATIVPIHYEGWSHFRESPALAEAAFAHASPAVRAAVRWVPLGEPAVMTV